MNVHTKVRNTKLSSMTSLAAAATSALRRRHTAPTVPPVSFRQWDPSAPPPPSPPPPTSTTSDAARSLSPLARFVLDSIRRNNLRWGPPVLRDLSKLRRIPPTLLAEILRSPLLPPRLSSPLFLHASRQRGFRPSYASFNALAHSLLRGSLLSAADLVPDLMLRLGKPPTEKQFEILLRVHASARRGLRVHRLYRRMVLSFGIRPRPRIFLLVLQSLVATGHLDLALGVHKDSQATALSFMILARGLCRHGRTEELLDLLDRMRRDCCRPDVFAYTAMLKSSVKGGHLDACLRLWEEAERDKVGMDAMAYTTIVSGLCAGGRVEEAWGFFLEMRRKGLLVDRAVYAALIDGFTKAGKIGKGCKILMEMAEDGYRADLLIYNTLITGLCAAGRVDKAGMLFSLVLQEGLLPEVMTVCPLLVKYVEDDNMCSFFELLKRFHDLVGWQKAADCAVEFFVLFADGTEEKAVKALGVLKELKGRGYCSVAAYNAVIEAFAKAKMFDRALVLFQEMMDGGSGGLEPECSTYNSIIPCFVQSGDVRGACSCYTTMKERSWIPSIGAYRSLANGLCDMGQISDAITVVKDCLGNIEGGPREFKYALTVINACRTGDPVKVMGVVDEMMDELSCPPDQVIHCAIIYGFCKYSSMKEANRVFSDLRDRGIITESKLVKLEDTLKEHMMRTTAGLVISGLKFSGLDSKMKALWSTHARKVFPIRVKK